MAEWEFDDCVLTETHNYYLLPFPKSIMMRQLLIHSESGGGQRTSIICSLSDGFLLALLLPLYVFCLLLIYQGDPFWVILMVEEQQ